MLFEEELRQKRRLAGLALVWESLWPRLAPIGLLAAAFTAFALLGIPTLIPAWAHAFILALFAAASLFFAWQVRKADFHPASARVDERLERDSRLAHQPLRAMDDPISGGRASTFTVALWRRHQQRLREQLRQLRIALPRPKFADKDRFFMRPIVFLSLSLGLFIGGYDWRDRLALAFNPQLNTGPKLVMRLDAWINPPDYTGAAPFALAGDGSMKKAHLPEGSELLARLNNAGTLADLFIDGKKASSFKATTGSDQEVALKIDKGETLSIRQGGRILYEWELKIRRDKAPTVFFKRKPQQTRKGILHLRYEAIDDYGLKKIWLRIAKRPEKPTTSKSKKPDTKSTAEKPFDMKIFDERENGSANLQSYKDAVYRDLTPHPWAGEKVRITLIASDQTDQIGRSKTIEITLPERQFSHPVARAIIEQRKSLIRNPKKLRSVYGTLKTIASSPKLYNNDVHTMLALEIAANRLRFQRQKAIPGLIDLLWDTALGVEDGNLSLAERTLRDAQQALLEALSRNATDEEITRLTKELRQAMNKFLQELARNATQRAMQGQQPQQQPNPDQTLNQQDLNRLLDQIQNMARAGAKQAARDMLRQLQNLMENLRANPQMARRGQMSPQQRSAEELQRLMQQQRNLQDQTFQKGRQGQQGRQGQRGQFGQQGRGQNRMGQMRPGQGQMGQGQLSPGEMQAMQGLAQMQEGLRRQLGELMRRFSEQAGDIPDALGRAERAMRSAREALNRGQPGAAMDFQSQAQQNLARTLRSILNNQPEGNRQAGDADGDDRTPDGPNSRSRTDMGDANGRQSLPSRMDLQRALEILKELHKRSGDRSRPKYELDYLERLMERF